ncbi:uncharacterized protein [Solanum lycopersicum]|uniref:uncharacterized protein n=1 Tax=Solanum lycopersicum TaxID=4081 RepID=UPI00374A661E
MGNSSDEESEDDETENKSILALEQEDDYDFVTLVAVENKEEKETCRSQETILALMAGSDSEEDKEEEDINEKSDEGIFLGYSSQSKAYKVLNKRTNRVEESVHVVFNENNSEVEGNSEDEQNEATCSRSSEPRIREEEFIPSHKTPEIEDKSATETGPSASQEPVNIQTHSWKHQSSHPLQNILTLLNSGISIRSKLRSICALSAYVSLIEPKKFKGST